MMARIVSGIGITQIGIIVSRSVIRGKKPTAVMIGKVTKMTQSDRIMKYLEMNGSITPMEAFSDLGITKLATRISEMVRAGAKIKKTYV